MKRILFSLLVITFIVPLIQKPTEVDALSCLFVPSRIGIIESIPQEKITGGNYQIYTLGNIKFPNQDTNLDTLTDQQDAYEKYISNSLQELEKSFYPDLEQEEIMEIFIPNIFERDLSVGDIVISGGKQSVAACGGAGLTTLFDEDTHQPKFMFYSGIPVGDYEVDNNTIELIGLDTPDDTTEYATFKIDGEIFNLNGEGFYRFLDADESMEIKIDQGIIDTLYLLNSTSGSSIWGSKPNASFVITFKQDVDGANLCNITYSRLIRYGRIGEDVRQTQQCLNNIGYDTGKVDGIYGPKTYAGIRDFQISQNIKIDGIVGPQTVSYLNKL